MDLNLTVAIISLIVATISVGVAVIFGVPSYISAYYAKKDHDKKNQDSVIRDGQIDERFTRAIDQLGSEKMEILLGAISSLEIIADKSADKSAYKDYWQIMELLTAYVKIHSRSKEENLNSEDIQYFSNCIGEKYKVDPDIKAILDVIKRRRFYLGAGESGGLELRGTYLRQVNLKGAHLEGAYLFDTDLMGVILEGAFLQGAYLERAYLNWAYLKGANLKGANLKGAYLREANLKGANLERTILEKANLVGANLVGAKNLTIDQLSKVKTLYNAKLDEELGIPLKKKYPALFEVPKR